MAGDPPASTSLRTLVFHDGALGDVLLSLTCLQVLRGAGDELHFVGRPDIGRLLAVLSAVDGFTSSDSGMFATLFASIPDERLNAFLGRFDRALLFQVRQDTVLLKNMRGALADVRTIVTVPPAGRVTHVAEFRRMQLGETPQAIVSDVPVIPQEVRNAARKTLDRAGYDGKAKLVIIHPGSGGRSKCWPLERYFETAERLSSGSGAFVLFLSGPAEEPVMRERIGRFVEGRERMSHLADTDLINVAGLLSRCGLFLGNDSGISHLAAAVRCPVIALFGPTDPELWRPRGPAVQVIAAEALGGITAEQVVDAAEEMMARHAFPHHRGCTGGKGSE